MKFVVTTAQMKNAEDISALNSVSKMQLMENAGEACAKAIDDMLGGAGGKNVVVLSGKGNNGGDGIVIAKNLSRMGAQAPVILVSGQPMSAEARAAFAKYSDQCIVVAYESRPDAVHNALASADLIVDCVFGTGFKGQLDGGTAELFAYINDLKSVKRLSVDIPSGVNGDTGEIAQNAFKPHTTLVLGAMKQGLLNHPCFDFCGEIQLLDIGITENCYRDYAAQMTDESIMKLLLPRPKNSNKGNYGRLVNIAGSAYYCGAAMLSSRAALRAGAGIVTLATPKRVVNAIAAAIPEVVFYPLDQNEDGFMERNAAKRLGLPLIDATAVAMGCGMGNNDNSRIIVRTVLKTGNCPLILDADGINCIANNINVIKDSGRPIVMTPHPRELSRATGLSVQEIQSDRLNIAKRFAREMNVVLLLKGVNTVIAAPDGRTFVNSTGNPALAKAGTGDVLTGIIGGLLAQGMEPFFAAALGAYVHGKCADKLVENASEASILASDIIEYLPYVLS